jgi:hypothetical protein
MNKHTPGPWEETYNTSDNTWGVCLPEGGDVLAQLIENQANATLLAAAPAMYEALQIMVRAANVDEIDPLVMFASVERAKGALAQAEGSKP